MISERRYRVAAARVSVYQSASRIMKEATIKDEDPIVIRDIPGWLSESTGLQVGDILAVEKETKAALFVVKPKAHSSLIETRQWIPKSQVVVGPANIKMDIKVVKEYQG